MSIAINSNFERDQYVATFTGQVNFVYTFPIYSQTYLTVYQYAAGATPDDPLQELILGVDYTVTGVGEAAGGTIILTVGATVGDIITIVGTQPIERESVFQDLNPFTVAINQQLNQLTIMMQQVFTYWANLSPHYNFDELVRSDYDGNAGVRPYKLILPMLPDGHVWVGRGQLGSIPDDIVTAPYAIVPGGGGSTTAEISQPGHTFVKGQIVRIETPTGLYKLALAINKELAEVAGMVVSSDIPNGTFIVQQSGYVTSAQAVVAGLTPGDPQFLSDVNPGEMMDTDVLIEGEVSRPVFYPDSADSGWILPYRGFIDNGSGDFGDGNPTGDGAPVIITVTQTGHGFGVGDILYVVTPSNPPEAEYDLADNTTYATAQAVGAVTEVVSANQFKLQQSGFCTGVITVDDLGAPVVASTVYYLSDVPGKVTSINPTGASFSRPIFISERTVALGGVYTGWIFPQRPLAGPVADPNSSPWVFLGELNQANNYSSQTILLDANGNTFNAYKLVVFPGSADIATYGIKGVSAGNLALGMQYFIDGVWKDALGTYASYMSGVNSTAGVDTATWWGYVRNSAGAVPETDKALLILPTAQDIILFSGEILLRNDPGITEMDFNVMLVDPIPIAPFGVGYTSVGWSGGGGGVAPATGFRIALSVGGTISPTCVGYIKVYGIPN